MSTEDTEPNEIIEHGDGPYRTIVAPKYQKLSDDEVESLLRRATGVLARNEWRRRYQRAREKDRVRVIESTAANTYRICGRWKASCEAAARMLAEPLESERICEKCRWYTPIEQTACRHPGRREPNGRMPRVGPHDACACFEAWKGAIRETEGREFGPTTAAVKGSNTPDSDAQSHIWHVVRMSDGTTREVFAREPGDASDHVLRRLPERQESQGE
jgi:hypothetical protein